MFISPSSTMLSIDLFLNDALVFTVPIIKGYNPHVLLSNVFDMMKKTY